MAVTIQTRKESYDFIQKKVRARRKQVYNVLKEYPEGKTAGELAMLLFKRGMTHNAERNNVHPRLNELEVLGYVEIVGKRTCKISGRKCAVYKVVERMMWGG